MTAPELKGLNSMGRQTSTWKKAIPQGRSRFRVRVRGPQERGPLSLKSGWALSGQECWVLEEVNADQRKGPRTGKGLRKLRQTCQKLRGKRDQLSSVSQMLSLNSFFFWPHLEASEILVPQPGIEPGPSAMRVQSPKPLACMLSHVPLSVTQSTAARPPGSSIHEIFQARKMRWVLPFPAPKPLDHQRIPPSLNS